MTMMRLNEYLLTFTPGSRPDRRTVIGQIERQELVGMKRGGLWYVDPDAKPAEQPIREVADALFARISARAG